MRPAGSRLARWLAGIPLLVGCGEPSSPVEMRLDDTRPDVLLIVVDTLRADHLTQYGYHRDTSGALARLTGSATRFDECYSPAPWTVPAVASLFTGLAPGRHGVDAVGAALPESTPTLARTLRRAGWQTGAISFNPQVTRAAGFDQGFDDFLAYRGKARGAPDIRAMTARALEWIEEVRDDGPFFLYLQPMNTHGPYRVPEDAREALLGRAPKESMKFFDPLMEGLMNEGQVERRAEVTPEMVGSIEEQYDTAIRHTADELGAFFDALAARGLWDDMVVVLTADHGEELFDHGGFAHRYSLYREVLHVPLFVKLRRQQRPHRIDLPVSIVDLPATLHDLLGLPTRRGDGQSLAPLLLGPDEPAPAHLRDRAFVAQATNRKRFIGRSLRVAHDELIVVEASYDGTRGTTRLYDLSQDPKQQRDLSGQHPDRVAHLRDQLEGIEAEYEAGALPERSYELNSELRDALEALGYL